MGLVVKNGSKACSITSGVMPVPVSDTHSDRQSPSCMSCRLAPFRSIRRLPVSMVIVPPSGIASRASRQRFGSAFSSWKGSTSVDHRPGIPAISTRMPSPATEMSMTPVKVNLKALDTRLRTIFSHISRSTRTGPASGGAWIAELPVTA